MSTVETRPNLRRCHDARAGEHHYPRAGSRQHIALLLLHRRGASSAKALQAESGSASNSYRYEVLAPLLEHGWARVCSSTHVAITAEGLDALRKIDPEFDDGSTGQETATGIPVRHAYRADPSAACLPGVDVSLLTGCGRRTSLGSGDKRPPVQRPGAAQADQYPSRRGDRLYYADGRVTDLQGRPLQAQGPGRASLPAHEYMRSWSERDREARR